MLRLNQVESVPLVRPPSSGLPWGTSTLTLGLGREIGLGMSFIPCWYLVILILICLNFPLQWRKGDNGPTPWLKHHGFGCMLFSVCIDTFYHPDHKFYIDGVHWKSSPDGSKDKVTNGADFSCPFTEIYV